MIILYHDGLHAVEISSDSDVNSIRIPLSGISKTLISLAETATDDWLIWCHIALKDHLNINAIEEIFHHQKIMASYHPGEANYLPEAIGYVEDSPFINIRKAVCYPTWRMSSWVGGVHAAVWCALKEELVPDRDFDYFLHSLAKRAMQQGLFCYSEPKLLKAKPALVFSKQANRRLLFRFVNQHFKTRWMFLLLLNFFIYEKKLPLRSFLSGFCYRKRVFSPQLLADIPIKSTRQIVQQKTIDVIIPTLGRKKYLYDVLKDLAAQTHRPKKVIIVEQNPEPGSISELNYLTDESWAFEIKHFFIHRTGACHARNLALEEVASEWVFLADDDIRMHSNFMREALSEIEQTGNKAFTLNCLQKHETNQNPYISQTSMFGSGCSFLHSSILSENIRFSKSFEHGYGEDADFGMQLRNKGFDVIFLPKPEILHLKAPSGGFRTTPKLAWQEDKPQPKPSPTVMLFRKTHYSAEQLWGYKTVLFFKFYRQQGVKNPIAYFNTFKNSWEKSLQWAKLLAKET
ncbi:MAG: glycosyltransferase [Bacteroidetes bacterium]|nr:glycosyltransferase [Bacteroidota bacterium]